MSIDHYIPQVYLKNFVPPDLKKFLRAIRKKDLHTFQPKPRNVCGIQNGSTNSYLINDREIEDFLERIEHKFPEALTKLTSRKPDPESIFTIAGILSYIVTCSPTGIRINSNNYETALGITAKMYDSQGLFPNPSNSADSESFTSLLETGKVKIKSDPKLSQAIGIRAVLGVTYSFGNFNWQLLFNRFNEHPFLTSDYPVVIERTADPRVLNRIFPLTPSVAIRIKPDISSVEDSSFRDFSLTSTSLTLTQVLNINKQIVRCAENLFFYRDDNSWIRKIVEKNRDYLVMPVNYVLGSTEDKVMYSTLRIKKASLDSEATILEI